MLDLFNILFVGTPWAGSVIYSIEQGESGDTAIIKNTQHSEKTIKTADHSKKLVGIENHCGMDGVNETVRLVDSLNWQETAGIYIITKKLPEARKILMKIFKGNTAEIELYGVDPDYFHTLVPIRSSQREIIEKYLLGLKSDQSLKGKIKLMLKGLLVSLNLSGKLYEKFIITVSPKS